MDNVADRLHSILEKASDVPAIYSVRTVWAVIFSVDANDLTSIYRSLFLMHQLLDEVERQIRLVPNISYNVYLKRLENIRRLISLPNLDADWGKHNGLITDGVFATLEFCAERLSSVRTERVPPDEEVEALRLAVESLKERVLSGGLDQDLQFILLDLLESMRRALNEYDFRGVDGLRQELFLILERLQKYYPIFKQHSDEPVVQAFWDVLTKFDTLTSIYLNVPQILGGIAKLLGG